jgi:hypothetical protein
MSVFSHTEDTLKGFEAVDQAWSNLATCGIGQIQQNLVCMQAI